MRIMIRSLVRRDAGVLTRILLAVLLCLALLMPVFLLQASAQRVQPGYGPEETADRMYTLQDVYDRLDTGATASQTENFSEPSTGPTVASGLPSLNDIFPLLPELDNANCASPFDVVSGKTFFSLCGASWGAQTGTLSLDPILATTGQDTCYDAGGNVISCTGTGQDGEYQLGNTADPRFTDNEDGTVTDNLTGLIWLQNATCFGTRAWETALNDANTLASGSCGLSDGSIAGDWRLPNINELASLIDYQTATAPRIPAGHPFSSVVSSFYWSSTSYRLNLVNAWNVSFSTGAYNTISKTFNRYVWPVR